MTQQRVNQPESDITALTISRTTCELKNKSLGLTSQRYPDQVFLPSTNRVLPFKPSSATHLCFTLTTAPERHIIGRMRPL
ncbi:uncharacterized protein BDV17DRAFT_274075 [Aspergillus undulatus]|uniref:uncharacterized protein n=1 Tax=Aspergillus undulatus TaxID=1810928 RepID=UPI003CCCE83C